MKLRGPLAAALAAVLLGAAPHAPAPTMFSAAAGSRPAGASPLNPADAVLPDGRIAAPLGATAFVGTNPLGVALSPDGGYAIVVNASQATNPPSTAPARAAEIVAGYSLAVIQARTMRIASIYRADGATFSGGVVALRDPLDPGRTLVLTSDGAHDLVRVFDLTPAGTLQPEGSDIALAKRCFPTTIVASPDGRSVYVTCDLADSVATIDLLARTVRATSAVGFYPHGLAVSGSRVLVANEGLSQYDAVSPASAPTFSNVTSDPSRASSLMVLPQPSGEASIVRMDEVPDGSVTVGGARPNAVVARRDGAYAYVSLGNVDRVATVALDGEPHVVGGLDLRLFVDYPYGTQPGAEVLSKDGKFLYVTMAGSNAVAVLEAKDPAQLHRLGLIPTAWYPSALALSPDGRYLYVADAKGVDGWGELQRIDLRELLKEERVGYDDRGKPVYELTQLRKATYAAFRYERREAPLRPNPVVPPLGQGKSSTIDRVVYISLGSGTFDAFLGDIGRGNADASLVQYGADATPNIHALATAYAFADNFYADDLDVDVNRLYGLGAADTLYTQRTLALNEGRAPLDAHAQDPENYTRAGYLFNECAREGVAYRDYGGLLNLSGYRPNIPGSNRRGRSADTGFGGTFDLSVPGLAALDGHVDANYPAGNEQIPDDVRASEFIRDMGGLVQDDREPAYTYVWLPAQGPGGVAGADRALGRIVAFLSRTPHWSSTAVFITADGVDGGRDHVNEARTFAIVVSPVARGGYVGHAHLSTASLVKTEEELLGLRPLSLADLLATDMADFFGDAPYPNPYQAIP